MRLDRAQSIAGSLVELLAPGCERIEIAGSIRREKPEVKDIELVVRPVWSDVPAGQGSLLEVATEPQNELALLLEREIEAGREIVPIKPGGHDVDPYRLKHGGRYWRLWLPRPRIKCDVFLADAERWGLAYMIRTGSGVGPISGDPRHGFAPAMLARWKRISNGGFSNGSTLRRPDRTVVPTPEEEDVFAALEMDWVPPRNRESSDAVPR